MELVVTCEHGGNRVPAEYASLFGGARAALDSHRGYDAGSLDVARASAAAYRAPLVHSETSRLLVDLNRSLHHRTLFSEFSRGLDAARRRRLLERHYLPYRRRVEDLVGERIARGGFVLHVSSHSFAPELQGRERKADVALLYDPKRASERQAAAVWLGALAAAAPAWTARRNYPYRGTADGLTTHLRKRFGAGEYAGLELEVNQRLVRQDDWSRAVEALVASLGAVLGAGLAAGLAAGRPEAGGSAALAPAGRDRRR